MDKNQHKVVGKINLGGLVIDVVKRVPCYRASAIGKGIPQYCKCANCADRNDFGKTLVPVSIDGKWEVVEKVS